MQTEDPRIEDLKAKRLLRESLEWLLGDDRGRSLVRLILERAGIDHPTPQAFGDGAYGMGWWLRAEIQKHCPGQWLALERARLEDEAHRIGLEEQREQERQLHEEPTP